MLLPILTLAILIGAVPPPIVSGQATTDYKPVGAIFAVDEKYYYGPFCSGTLIEEHWVVTAGHCVEAIQGDYDKYDILFALGGDVIDDDFIDWSWISESILHPDYLFDDKTSEIDSDIGLLAIDGIDSVSPMPVNDEAIGHSWIGDDLRYVGFGITADSRKDSGVKRFADIPVYNYDDQFVYGYDPDDGDNVCSGDSGGAALEILSGGAFALAGVNAFVALFGTGSRPCVDGGNGATRLDVFLPWIQDELGSDFANVVIDGDADIDTDGDTDTPARPEDEDPWIVNCSMVPLPRTGATGLLLALAVLLARRRR